MTAPTPAPMMILPLSEERLREIIREELSGLTPKGDEGPLLLTCSALCRRLGVSRASVYRWRGEGMPSLRAGDEHRYELDAVMSWLRGRA